MSQLRKPIFVLCVLAAFLILSARSALLSQRNAGSFKTQTQPERRALSPEEKRGKAFYLRGESSSGQEITAMGARLRYRRRLLLALVATEPVAKERLRAE